MNLKVSEENCKVVFKALEKEFLSRGNFTFTSKRFGRICGISPTIIGHVAAREAYRGGCCVKLVKASSRGFVFRTTFEVVKE